MEYRNIWHGLFIFLCLGAGCDSGQSATAADEVRGDGTAELKVAGKGDGGDWLSCKGYCGDYDKKWDCQCDDKCATYGDCCEDYNQVCEAGNQCPATGIMCSPDCKEGPNSHCKKGNFNADTCQCEPLDAKCPATGIMCSPDCKEAPNSHCKKGVFNSKTCTCDSLAGKCGGLLGLQCKDGYYCNYDETNAQCGAGDQVGVCKELHKFMTCAAVYKPVCGCDGKTYSNSCTAHRVGVSVASQGKCK